MYIYHFSHDSSVALTVGWSLAQYSTLFQTEILHDCHEIQYRYLWPQDRVNSTDSDEPLFFSVFL